MRQRICTAVVGLTIILAVAAVVTAQEGKPGGRPPAPVVVAKITSGTVAPASEFIGTVYFVEVSDVAAETSGRIDEVTFEEGQRRRRGDVLVRVNTDLIDKNIQSTRASHEQVLSELAKARLDLKRIEKLYEKRVVAKQEFDEIDFRVRGLEKRAISLNAQVERLQVERGRTRVRAPFDGVVLKKHVARGEWLAEGSVVATMARDDAVDIVTEIPQKIIGLVTTGMEVRVSAVGQTLRGRVTAIIPRGDVATRTFPVKVRVSHGLSLLEGMEVRVRLPVAEPLDAFILPRDAVITMFGNTVVYTVENSTARMLPVEVVGYQGMTVGVQSPELTDGMSVVVKGNERLRDGQPVAITQGTG
jgi:RND family efflux transporter MFP subunit